MRNKHPSTLVEESSARYDAFATGRDDDAVRPPPVWAAALRRCDIVWHVHVPKSGGTAVEDLLRRTAAGWVNLLPEGHHIYVSHGRTHDWAKVNLGELAAARGQVVVSAETGVRCARSRTFTLTPWPRPNIFKSQRLSLPVEHCELRR